MSQIVPRLALGAAAALLAVGVIPPTVARADPEVPSGPYDYVAQADSGGSAKGSWNFTSCGPSCATANSDNSPANNWQFRLSNGRWTFNGPDQFPCPGGEGLVNRTVNASFDAVTLAGDWTATMTNACAPFPAGSTMGPWHFQLTKVG